MPNRLIKESICTSDNLNSLSKDAELLFYRLIVNCDDYGLLDARPSIIRAKCFPLRLDIISDQDIEERLGELVKAKLIFLYMVKGKRYLKMTSWEKHQQIRCQKSKYPMPESNGNQMVSDDIRFPRNPNPIQSESISESEIEPHAPDGAGECSAAVDNVNNVDSTPAEKSQTDNEESDGAQTKSGKGEYTKDFEEFWSHYPRKVEKHTAFRAWKARLKGGAKAEDIIKACINYAEYCNAQNTEMQYIKHPSTFIGPDRPYEEFINGPPVKDTNISKNTRFKAPVTTFNSYDQRHYDVKELEKKLLGRDDNIEDNG